MDELVTAIAEHEREFPTHGVNCVHMDLYIRELRKYMHTLTVAQWTRVAYVFREAGRLH